MAAGRGERPQGVPRGRRTYWRSRRACFKVRRSYWRVMRNSDGSGVAEHVRELMGVMEATRGAEGRESCWGPRVVLRAACFPLTGS